MTVYAPSDHTSIHIPADRGGCGESHYRGITETGDPAVFSVNCPKCEPHIMAMKTGWAATPAGVSLTPDEIGEAEASEASAKRQQNRTWGDPSVFAAEFAKAIGAGPGQTQSPSLLAQIAALSSEERAALAGMLLAGAPVAAETPTEADDAAASGDDGAEPMLPPVAVSGDVEPVKRGPGRPRIRV